MSKVVVVSGCTGSGKTTLSRVLCHSTGFHCVNFGDQLRAELRRREVAPATRREIGPQFLELCGLDDYLRLLHACADLGTVLDGVRLFAGVTHLRSAALPVVHVFRDGPSPAVSEELFEEELGRLRADADVVVPWKPTVAGVEAEGGALAYAW
ncbi:MAG: AAA family ATPase [Acidimicrobiales bacterium]